MTELDSTSNKSNLMHTLNNAKFYLLKEFLKNIYNIQNYKYAIKNCDFKRRRRIYSKLN